MKRNTHAGFFRVALCLLLAALSLLQGCLRVAPTDPTQTEAQSVSGTPYLYETMTYTYKTDSSAFLSDLLTGMNASYLMLVNKQHPVTNAYELDAAGYLLEEGVLLTRNTAKS